MTDDNAQNAPEMSNPQAVKGIGGWLYLVIFGLVGTVMLTMYNLGSAFEGESLEGLKMIFGESAGQLAAMRVPIIVSTVAGLAVIFSAVILLVKLFKYGKNVKQFALVHYGLLALAGVADFWGFQSMQSALPGQISSDPTITRGLVRGFIILAIWGTYFQVSKRVQNTYG